MRPMTWTPVAKPKHHKAHDSRQLRILNPYTGYLDVSSRQFLFDGKKGGYVIFEKESDQGSMSVIPCQQAARDAVHVTLAGRFSAQTITTIYPRVPLPVSILLTPFEDECRLLFSGVVKP